MTRRKPQLPGDRFCRVLSALAVLLSGMAAPCQAPADGSGGSPEREHEEVHENSIGMRFIQVQPGEFLMGSPPQEPGRFAGEQQHTVRITKAYWLGMEEVTEKQFLAVYGPNPVPPEHLNAPLAGLSWYDADEFCRKLSALKAEQEAGRHYRLPTEAEWEYACRAGTTTVYSWGDDPAKADDYAWLAANSELAKKRVGSRQANPWGFYDLHGNVWEWCSDWYQDFTPEAAVDPAGALTGEYRVLRGGAFDSPRSYLRSAIRIPWEPAGFVAEGAATGMRAVMILEQPQPSTTDK